MSDSSGKVVFSAKSEGEVVVVGSGGVGSKVVGIAKSLKMGFGQLRDSIGAGTA